MTGARPVSAAPETGRQLGKLLEALTDPETTAIPRSAFDSIARLDDVRRLADFAFAVWGRLRRRDGGVNVRTLRLLAQELGTAAESAADVRAVFDYLLLWVEARRYFEENELGFASHRELLVNGCLGDLAARLDDCRPALSTHYGPLMFEAMLASGADRSKAAALFRRARGEHPELAAAMDMDHFSSTYFSAEEIRAAAPVSGQRHAALIEAHQHLTEPAPADREGVCLLFSCDTGFLEVYFPYWASVAGWLRHIGVRLHFLVVGERAEAAAAVDRALELVDALASLRGVDPVAIRSSLSFSTAPVPEWVVSPRTFYACARYLLASEVGASSDGRLLIVDIDTTLVSDPTEFMRDIRGRPPGEMGVVDVRGLSCLMPARRFGGSTCLAPHPTAGDSGMRHVAEYMYVGLTSPTSWTLDQISLDYAVTRTEASGGEGSAVADLSRALHPRPFIQGPIRRFYRAGVRRDGG